MLYSAQSQATHKTKTRFELGPKYAMLPLQISVVVTFILLLIALVAQFVMQPAFPLFYSLSSGSNQIVPKAWLFLLPGLSLIFNFIHIGAIRLFNLHKLIEKLFSWADLILQIILLLITFRNILIVL